MLQLVIDEMIPAVAAEGLAEWNDVFCERGVFTPAEAQRILDAGRRAGLGPQGIPRRTSLVRPAARRWRRWSARTESADHVVFLG